MDPSKVPKKFLVWSHTRHIDYLSDVCLSLIIIKKNAKFCTSKSKSKSHVKYLGFRFYFFSKHYYGGRSSPKKENLEGLILSNIYLSRKFGSNDFLKILMKKWFFLDAENEKRRHMSGGQQKNFSS